ncbi:MAG TPA: secretion protein HlyD [Candidatus Sulfotelmatobacter sp.]|nr:secretion protein HlyD [Candidatus Sulfotelmatobacter sp.]
MKKRILILLVLLVLAGVGAWLLTAKGRRANQGTLQLYGNVDIREVNLGFRVPGRLAQVLRDEGDAVKACEVLGRLDDEPYRREVEEARAQVASLRAHVQLLEAGYRPQEIAQAHAVAREREVTAANAERVYKRQEELFQAKTVSIQERDDAEAKYREAEARLKSAREQLNLLEAGFRAEDIAQAKADLARAEAALASAELRLDDTVLKAPAAGVILTRAQEPGAILQAGTTVLTVSLTRPVWVRAYVQEPELGRIHPGMQVEVYTDSRPDKPYRGQIGYISPRAEFTPKNVETTELRTSLVYRLRVVVDDPDEGLRQGMPVTVRVVK